MRNAHRYRPAGLMASLLIIVLAGLARAEDDAQNKRLFLPAVVGAKPAAPDCNVPNTSFSALSINGDPLTVDPDHDENLNLGYRGYEETNASTHLVTHDGPPGDRNAPQFPGLFRDRRTPAFTQGYQRYRWDEECDCPQDTYSPWDVTVLGMGVAPGETIHTPDSGYDIGGGYEYMVMYAGETDITLHIGREDEFHGYVVHLDGVCTDPDLLSLYRQLHAAGRAELPALRGHQPFGRAVGNEIQIAIRDTGNFLDPRSRTDWWQGR